jgi:hypothetical protein
MAELSGQQEPVRERPYNKKEHPCNENTIFCPPPNTPVAQSFRVCGTADAGVVKVTAEVWNPTNTAVVQTGMPTPATLSARRWLTSFSNVPITVPGPPDNLKVTFTFDNGNQVALNQPLPVAGGSAIDCIHTPPGGTCP